MLKMLDHLILVGCLDLSEVNRFGNIQIAFIPHILRVSIGIPEGKRFGDIKNFFASPITEGDLIRFGHR